MSIPESVGWDKGRKAVGVVGSKMAQIQDYLRTFSRDWVLGGICALSASAGVGLGFLIAQENPKPGDSLWIEQLPKEELPGSVGTSTGVVADIQGVASGKAGSGTDPATSTKESNAQNDPGQAVKATGTYVASKTGSKYYLPSCAGAKRIKDENKVWFATKTAAETAGYSTASNCKGL